MTKPRFKRRKEDRPQEITAAAFDAFAENGYASTRVEEVAKRAGISKGLMYLYFKTKEELFKAVIKSVVVPRIDALTTALEENELPAKEFLRGPALTFLQRIPASRVAVVIRLLIAESGRHPDLAAYYYDNVVAKGLKTLTRFIERGIANGEFRKTAVTDLPQLIVAPVMMSVIWRIVFNDKPLDTDKLIATQMDLLIDHIKARPESGE